MASALLATRPQFSWKASLIVFGTLTRYKCTHTCTHKTKNKNTAAPVYNDWDACLDHMKSASSHPMCSAACSGYTIGAMKQQDDCVNVKLESVDSKPGDVKYTFKCAHTCHCEGSSSSIFGVGGRSFQSRIGAQNHMASKSKHPKCSSSCPALSGRIDPLGLLVDEDSAQTDEESHSSQKRGSDHHTSESAPPAKKARVSSPPRIESASSNQGRNAPTPTISSSSNVQMTDAYLSVYRDAVLLRLGVLKRLRRNLSLLPPELKYLHNSLCLLSCTTHNTTYLACYTGGAINPDINVTDELVSMLTGIIDSVKLTDRELLGVIDVDDACLPKLRELRRSLSKVYDDLLDLRFDIKDTIRNSGAKGLVQGREGTKVVLYNVSDELTEIGDQMDKLLSVVISRLLEA